MSEEKVIVRITAEQKVRYYKTVEMTRERWEEIKKIPDRDMEREYLSPLPDFINDHDIQDWDDFEDVEMVVVDENDKVIEPEDCYMGGDPED